MSDIRAWSPVAASNNSAPPDGAPENAMHFSEINDWMRETHAALRRQHENAQWIDYGHTVSYISAASFKVAGSDVRTIYGDTRRVVTYNGAGTVYGSVLSSTYAAGDTTITLTVDSGSLDSSLSSAAVGILTPTNGAAPSASTRQSLSALESQTISTSALVAQTATVSALTANNITVSALNAQKGTISALVANTATISQMGVQTASISSLLVGSLSTSALNVGGFAVTGRALAGAWVNVVQSLTACSIVGALNVTTVSAIGSGRYRVQFTGSMSAGYAYSVTPQQDQGTLVIFAGLDQSYSASNGGFPVSMISSGGGYVNPGRWSAIFFGKKG